MPSRHHRPPRTWATDRDGYVVLARGTDWLMVRIPGVGPFAMPRDREDRERFLREVLQPQLLPSRVQHTSNTATAASSVSKAWGSSTTAGNFAAAIVTSTNTTSLTMSSVSAGWTSTPAASFDDGQTPHRQIFIMQAVNIGAGQATPTFTLSGSSLALTLNIAEYSGIRTTSPFDKASAGNSGNSASPSTGSSGTLTVSGELGIAGIAVAGSDSFTSPTNSYAIVDQEVASGSAVTTGALLDIQSGVGTAATSTGCTSNNSGRWAGLIATFMPPAVATGESFLPLMGCG